MRRFVTRLVCGGAALLAAGPAQATVATLTFEGAGNYAQIQNFYNGGTSSDGTSGQDLGIAFSDNSLALVDADDGGGGNFANEPSSNTVLFFLSGGAATMNVANGFDNAFSFYYASYAGAYVNVYDGLDGTGNVLAQLELGGYAFDNCTGDPSGSYCNWSKVGIAFNGVAHSVDFGGAANYVAFDNITLGLANPGIAGDGTTPQTPVTPTTTTDEGFDFSLNVTGGQIVYIDPFVASGYDYIVNSGPNIVSAIFPELGDVDGYQIYALDDLTTLLGTVMGNQTFFFAPGGVSGFSLRGIDVGLMLDPDDTQAFVTGLGFDSNGPVNISQNPVTTFVAGSGTPEPAQWALLLGGFGLMGGALRRRRKARTIFA